MSADDGAIDEVQAPVNLATPVGLGLQGFQDTRPDAGLAPPIKPAGHGADGALALRQVLPGGTGSQDPENSVHNGSMIVVGAPGFGLLRRQQRFQPSPLLLC